MSLSPLHKHLVRRTFMQLAAYEEQATRLFHQRLRELNPALLTLFTAEAGTQPQRPMETLAVMISLIDNPAALSRQIGAIQARQQHYHLSGEQFQQIGDALLWVIEQRLGQTFTRDIQTAWLAFYRFLGHLPAESP